MQNRIIINIEDKYLPGYPGKGYGPSLSWCWRTGESWVILGENGSGKTHFSELIRAEHPGRVEKVSFEDLENILEDEIRRDDSEYTGKVDTGTPLWRFLGLKSPGSLPAGAPPLPAGMEKLMESGLRVLSTGEVRKSLIYRALLSSPDLLILDEPFDGLDRGSVLVMQEMLNGLLKENYPLLMILNRKSEILEAHSHVGVFREFELSFCGRRREWEAIEQDASDRKKRRPVPAAPEELRKEIPPVLVDIRNTTVRYGEKTILDRINWKVERGQHWKITGPNGAGKSTLLNLISGDQNQVYANDVSLFGKRRGSGESIWEIKEKLGIISPALQLNYRVSLSARMCIVSGLYDSIGVYNSVSPREKALADAWLRCLEMEDKADRPMKRLSYGEQRLLLIARGLIKHPPLIILDEPCQGLDDENRLRVLELLEDFVRGSESTLLYVTHHEEDRVEGIEHHLCFVPYKENGETGEAGFTLTANGLPLH